MCEGDVIKLDDDRPSPQQYSKMEKTPDANFYKAAIPNWWREYRPQFFNCGDRIDVIDTFFRLQEMHKSNPNDSYLDPDKLFAIADLDLQVCNIDNYLFSDTETIFHNLYQATQVNLSTVAQHRIWVTGLIHKEAYFLLPEIQQIFDDHPVPSFFDGAILDLNKIYISMSANITSDADLSNHFSRACNRISYCNILDCRDLAHLENSWKSQFATPDKTLKRKLIFALLMIKKAKPFWNQIIPDSSVWTSGDNAFREQIMLRIGRFYSEQLVKNEHHIPTFFQTIYKVVYP